LGVSQEKFLVVGFIILIGLVVYLIISLIVIYLGVRYARKKSIPGWKGGVLAAIVMYLLMFWDFIPFHIAHQYYCATDGGFRLNKTLEEWKAENPEVAEKLVPYENPEYTKSDSKERYVLNQRFAWDIYTTKQFLNIRKRDERIVDMKSNKILAQYVDYDSSQQTQRPEEFRDFKFWIYKESCEADVNSRLRFSSFQKSIENYKE
jgi:hypothetical protein